MGFHRNSERNLPDSLTETVAACESAL
jgi:hypothetical protein